MVVWPMAEARRRCRPAEVGRRSGRLTGGEGDKARRVRKGGVAGGRRGGGEPPAGEVVGGGGGGGRKKTSEASEEEDYSK
jgi:hypothetical protein